MHQLLYLILNFQHSFIFAFPVSCCWPLLPPFRSDLELLGPNNQYLPKIVSVFAEVSCFKHSCEIVVIITSCNNVVGSESFIQFLLPQYMDFGWDFLSLYFFSEVRSLLNCFAAGSLCWQGSCLGANCKSYGKFVKAATTDAASIHPGLDMVVLAASTAARVADNSVILVLTSDDAFSNRWFHIACELSVVVCADQVFVCPFFLIREVSRILLHKVLVEWGSILRWNGRESVDWCILQDHLCCFQKQGGTWCSIYLFGRFLWTIVLFEDCYRGNSCLSFGQIMHFFLSSFIVQGFGVENTLLFILFICWHWLELLFPTSYMRNDTILDVKSYILLFMYHYV